MSASYVVDLSSTVERRASVSIGSGASFTVGEIVDLLQANTLCNVYCAGGVPGGSGVIEVRLQTSDSTTSGSFTDPTSGLAAFETTVQSGGVIFFNSGLPGSGNFAACAPVAAAPEFCSGGISFAAFQRPQRYARLLTNSGVYPGAISAGFISQKKVIGSGGGTTQLPGSGAINV